MTFNNYIILTRFEWFFLPGAIHRFRQRNLVHEPKIERSNDTRVLTDNDLNGGSHHDTQEVMVTNHDATFVHTNPSLPPNWPSEIRCEMNITAWEDALGKAGLLPEYSDVLHGFRHGFDQGIPEHTLHDALTKEPLQYFTPPNHSSATIAAGKIADSMREEVLARRMFGPFTKEQVSSVFPFFRTSPMGAVINGDGSLRPINDLSYPRDQPDTPSVHSFVNPDHFKTTWDDFKTVAAFFSSSSEKWLLALFDWEKAYRQIPTSMPQWRYLLILGMDGYIYVDTRITFGGVAGCGSFGRPADAWKHVMIYEFDVFTIFRWVDDNLFVKRLLSTTDMKGIVERSQGLGVLSNKKKCSEFAYEQKFVGFIWNGVEKTV